MNYLGVVSLLVCFAITLPGVRKRKDADLYLLIGVLVRFASVLFYSYMGDADPDGYGAMALMYSHMSPEQLILNFPTGAYFYSWLISFPYRLFGPNEMMIRSINGLLYCWSLFISYDLAKSLYGERPAKKSSPIPRGISRHYSFCRSFCVTRGFICLAHDAIASASVSIL